MAEQHRCYDAFISYSHKDSQTAKKVWKYLQNYGATGNKISAFMDEDAISPGESIAEKINKALESARFFLILLSPAAIDADWTTAERNAALLSDPAGRLGRVIPLIVKDCNIPPLMRIRKWVDLRRDSDFDKKMDRVASLIAGRSLSQRDTEGGRMLESGAVGTSSLCPYSHEPDAIDEVLYTNLYEVEELPRIFTAPTSYPSRLAIARDFGCKTPTCIMSSNKLYTTSDIDNVDNPLRRAVDTGDIRSVDEGSWLKDNDHEKLLTALLNLQADHFCRGLGLSYDHIGKKHYCDINRVTKGITWTLNVRSSTRSMILPHERDGKVYFYRHRALKLSYHIFGSRVFLQLEPSWTFTSDGSAVVEDRKRRAVLNTRIQSMIRNDAQFGEQKFWAWLLSKKGSITIGENNNPVTTSLVPMKLTSQVGIHGDYQHSSFDSSDPPPIACEAITPLEGRGDAV